MSKVAAEEQVRVVRETGPLAIVAELRSFLGLTSFSSRFFPNFATTAEAAVF